MTIDAIKSEVFIEAPVGVVWDLVTQPENLNRWWTDEAEFDLETGAVGQLVWIDKATSRRDLAALTIESWLSTTCSHSGGSTNPGRHPTKETQCS